ncbi:MAG: PD-(D/E)XK nuclease family protein [Labilithrix sp.]|nr:PD-(D/E)XK nuclease family protein [Labilithrix sp.]
MRPIAGLSLGGAVLREHTGARRALLGAPVWGPSGLLRDLELRLGLPPVDESTTARLPRWAERVKAPGDEFAFYMRSLALDELGTATVLLEWRDALVEAGWDGGPIAGGGERLDALARLERLDGEAVPPGRADRLVRCARALASAPSRPYDAITLVDDASLWPRRWRDIFDRLEALGTAFARLEVALPGAPPSTDLGLLQARLRGEARDGAVRGDGTLLFLQSDTPSDLAELTAALLAQGRTRGSDVVVRCRDAQTLEAGLARQGLPAQGCSSESVWRPAMQVLALAVELAFEPRDPYRVLELLTLAIGPFRGRLGARLARAVTHQPGIGGKEWTRRKAEAATQLHARRVRTELARGRSESEAEELARAFVAERLELVATWLEGVAADPRGAPRGHLLAAVERARAWLRSRLRDGEIDVYGIAYAQAATFAQTIANDTRELLSQEDARQLLDLVARNGQEHALSVELAGRVAHVDHPAGLLAPYDRVFLWSFVAGVERRPARSTWNEDERAALLAAGVAFPDPSALLRAEADAWRRAVLAARERVVFVVPRTITGTATAPHPLWDEIRARLELDERGAARLTREARRILERRGGVADASALVPLEHAPPLPLPEPRSAFRVTGDALGATAGGGPTSVTSLEKIATCPLAWVLEHRAALRSGAMSKVATGALLNGGLSHRLVEELHGEDAFALAEDAFLARATAVFERLLRTEGATLLLPGASIERLQLTRQVRQGIRALYRYLAEGGFRIAGVEEIVTTDSVVGPLHGRLDLRLVDRDGRSAILDLKWGASSYRALLADGRAVQLAVYARAVAEAYGQGSTPAAYFALSSGEVLAADPRMKPERVIDGPSLETTWTHIETTAKAVLESHARGTVHVPGTKLALPLLDALGVPEADRDRHFEAARDAACRYCDYDALCGRKWEALT